MYLPEFTSSKSPRADQGPNGPQREYGVKWCYRLLRLLLHSSSNPTSLVSLAKTTIFKNNASSL